MVVAARKARESAWIFMARSSNLHDDFGGVKRSSEPLLFAVISRAIPKAWPSDAGRAMPADDLPVGVLADDVVEEQVLGNDGIAYTHLRAHETRHELVCSI